MWNVKWAVFTFEKFWFTGLDQELRSFFVNVVSEVKIFGDVGRGLL
jgi:hypothetical protein